MVDFKRSYVSDYEFEPYPGDRDYDDPKARENVKRAYDNMKLGRPIFISTAVLKGPFDKGFIPLGELSRAARRRARRGVYIHPVPAIAHQIQEAQGPTALPHQLLEAQPVPDLPYQIQDVQTVPAIPLQIQDAQPAPAIPLPIQEAQPVPASPLPIQDAQPAPAVSLPIEETQPVSASPHQIPEVQPRSKRRKLSHEEQGSDGNTPREQDDAAVTSGSSSYAELPEEAIRHDVLQPKQSDTAATQAHSTENTDGEVLVQLPDVSPTAAELPVATPPAEILEAVGKSPEAPVDVEIHLPTPSKTLDNPAGNLELREEQVENTAVRPAVTSPQSGLITPSDSAETPHPDPVMYIEDTFAETGPSGNLVEAEATQAQPNNPVLSPVHDAMEDIEEFTPVVDIGGRISSPDHGSASSPLAIATLPLLPVDVPIFGFTAVNSSMAQPAVSPVPVPQHQDEPVESEPAKARRATAAPKAKIIKRAVRASGVAGQRSCLECGLTQKIGWLPGPAGSATLCKKCGTKWRKQNKDKKQAKSTTSKKTKPATKKLVPALDLAPRLQDAAQSFGVLSPRKERPKRAAKPTYSMAIPPLPADSYDTTQDKPSSQAPVPASARKRSLAFGVSPHQRVLDHMYGMDILRTAMKLTNIDKLKALLDDGFASHITNRLELSSNRIHAHGTPRVTESDMPEVVLATPTDRLRRPKAKRIMTFDSPTSVKAPSRLRNKLSSGDAGEVTAQKAQEAPIAHQDVHNSPPPLEMLRTRPDSPVVADAAEEEEVMVSALTSPAELIERNNTPEGVQAEHQTSTTSSRRQSSQVNSPTPVEMASTQALLQGGVDLCSSILDSPAPPPGSALATPAPSTILAAKTVLARATPGSMGPPSLPRSSHSAQSEDAAPANTQALFAEFGGLTDDSSPQSMHSARSKSSLHMSPAFEKSPLSPRLQHNDVVTPASFFSLAKRPGQVLRSVFSPAMPESAGGESLFRFADITEVPSQAVEQSQAEEDEQELVDLDQIVQRGDSLLGLSQPHF